MHILYLNVGVPRLGNDIMKMTIKSKADYLELAAQAEGIDYVRRWEEGCGAEYVLNIHPYHKDYKIVEWRKGSKWTGNWEMDNLVCRERQQESWDQTDTVFLCNRFQWKPHYPRKFEYLYEACWPPLYEEVDPVVDFVQIGTLKDEHHWRDFGVNGPCPQTDIYTERRRLYSLLSTKYQVEYHNEYQTVREYLSTLSRGRIQFIQSMHVLGENEIAQRFWESLPIGPVLTCYSPTLDNLDLVEGEDYLVYRSDTDLMEKAHWLLTDKNYYNKIKQQGRKAAKRHTYIQRLNQLISYLEKNYGFQRNVPDNGNLSP